MKQERQVEGLVLPSERREKKCERSAFIPYEYNIKIINRNIKILNGSAICTVTVAIVHKCTIMHKLVWVFFSSNCVKSATFSILHNYAQADVIALVKFQKFSLFKITREKKKEPKRKIL